MIPLHKVFLPPRDALMPALEEVLYSGRITEGEQVREFEDRFAAHFGTPSGLSFYSATAALHEALLLAGVQPGDEVISTPVTVEPTNMAIKHAGARIIWADVDPTNGNISPESVESRITERTRAIMCVHYEGTPVALEALRRVAKRNRIPVIEDAAHALGASYARRPIGCHSEFVVFSFQAIKHMTTVDGGMLIIRDEKLRERGRLMRWFGIDRTLPRLDQRVNEVGYKYHMNNVNATIGLVQLDHIETVIAAHRLNGTWFERELVGDGLSPCRRDPAASPAYWHFVVLVERRDEFVAAMRSRNIEASAGIIRNDLHPVFGGADSSLPGVDAFTSRMALLPCGWWLTVEDRERIRDAVRQGW